MEKIYCPFCGVKLNIQTVKEVDFSIKDAENKVWCVPCQRYIKFSLKEKHENTADDRKV